jgi:hypothetical protein
MLLSFPLPSLLRAYIHPTSRFLKFSRIYTHFGCMYPLFRPCTHPLLSSYPPPSIPCIGSPSRSPAIPPFSSDSGRSVGMCYTRWCHTTSVCQLQLKFNKIAFIRTYLQGVLSELACGPESRHLQGRLGVAWRGVGSEDLEYTNEKETERISPATCHEHIYRRYTISTKEMSHRVFGHFWAKSLQIKCRHEHLPIP